MALTAQEEALVRQLLDEQAAILSLAGSEATILSKLGATKVTLSDLTAVSTVADADLLLMRQGTTDKSLSALIFGAYAASAVPAASETVAGKIEIANASESQSLTDLVRALTPGRLASAFQGANQSFAVNGYQKLPGGFIMQWGTTASITGAGGSLSTTLPIAFPSAILKVMIVPNFFGGGTSTPPWISSKSASSFTITNQNANAGTFDYIAIGY